MKLKLFPLSLLLLAGLAAPCHASGAPGSPGPAKSRWTVSETQLGIVPTNGVYGQPLLDEHGWNYGLAVQNGNRTTLWLNGRFTQSFSDFVQAEIMDAGLVFKYEFSSDGKRLAYVVRQDGKMQMIVDGRPDLPEEYVGHPIFSPDGQHLAYEVRQKGRQFLKVDDVAGPLFDIVGRPIEFSPDGRRIAYSARKDGEDFMVIDQKERPDWPGTGWPVFSPDSKRLAYLAEGGAVVVDGVKGPEWGGNTWWGPIFSTDSRRFAYLVGTRSENTTHTRAFIDGKPLPLPNDGTNVLHVFFSPDLKRWACTTRADGKDQAYVDGQFGPVYGSVYGIEFNEDGSRHAYLAEIGDDWWMVVDGKLEAEISIDPSSPQFSPDGKRLAYIAGRGPLWWMVVDGKTGPTFTGTKEFRLWAAGEVQVPGLTQPKFSLDSQHIAYAALQDGQWGAWIDNQRAGAMYDTIIHGGPSFRENGSLEFLGIRKGVLYRVICKPPRT